MNAIETIKRESGPPRTIEPKQNGQQVSIEIKPRPTVYVRLQGPWVRAARNDPGFLESVKRNRDPRLRAALLRHRHIIQLPSKYFGQSIVKGLRAFLWSPRSVLDSWLNLPGKAHSYFAAILGGRVSAEEKDARDKTCGECNEREIVVDLRRDGTVRESVYCGPCQCGHKKRAKLDRKNWWRRARCPLRKHDGEYPDDVVRRYLLEVGYATKNDLDSAGTGCASCGKAAKSSADQEGGTNG